MKQIQLLIHLLTYSIGIGAFGLGITVFLKTRKKTILYYLLLLIACGFHQLYHTYKLLGDLFHLPPNRCMHIISDYFGSLAIGLGICMIPFCFCELLNLPLSRRKKWVLILLGFLYPVYASIHLFSSFQNHFLVFTFFWLVQIISFLNIVTTFRLTIKNVSQLTDQSTRRLIKNFQRTIIIFFPLLLMDLVIDKFFRHFPFLPGHYFFTSLFCLFICLFSFQFLAAQFFQLTSISSETITLAPEFLRQYQISEREKEVLLLMLKRYRNQEIATELCISLATVKTHINNIYQKLGINNRLNLITLIKKAG